MQAFHAVLLLFCTIGLYMASFAPILLAYPLLAGILGGSVTLVLMQRSRHARWSLALLAAWLFCLYALLGWASGVNQASYGMPFQHIMQIEGRLVEDSLLTRSSKQLARIALTACRSKDG